MLQRCQAQFRLFSRIRFIIIVQGTAQSMQAIQASGRSSSIPISVLNMPSLDSLEEVGYCSQRVVYKISGTRNLLESTHVQIPRGKLFSLLQTYEWRSQTQFPIVKTKYINIKASTSQASNIITIQVYTQYCPYKLAQLNGISLSQTLYLLKESLVGFQRLYSRFGGFEVNSSMVSINEKGYCKVWLNQNFAVNEIGRCNCSEAVMVDQIQQIMEVQCLQSKGSRKLFSRLKPCRTFLSIIREVENFIVETKALVSKNFVLSCLRDSSRTQLANPTDRKMNNQSISSRNFRLSIKSPSIEKKLSEIRFQAKSKRTPQTSLIKRFKSQEKIPWNVMKTSDRETSYTRNNKQSRASNAPSKKFLNESKQNPETPTRFSPKKNSRNWVEESSFIMDVEAENKKKQKKQLSHSEAAIKANEQIVKNITNRKLSANIVSLSPDSPGFHKTLSSKSGNNQQKKSAFQMYANEFNNVLESLNNKSITPRRSIVEQEQEQKYKEEVSDQIMKNNGWNGFTGLIDSPTALNESFHEGQEVVACRRDVKLEKLDAIGKRPVAMSIMPEDYEQIF